MSPKREIVEISSDSSDSSDSSYDTTPFPPYLPPYRPPRRGSRTKEQARKFKHDINAAILPWSSKMQGSSKGKGEGTSGSAHGEETSELAKKLPNALAQALDTAMASLNKIPVPETSKSSRRPPLKVLVGLACKKLWSKDMHKKKSDPKDKGKKSME